MTQVASQYGISGAGIQQGAQSGLAAAQAISRKNLADVQAAAAAMQKDRSLAGVNGKGGNDDDGADKDGKGHDKVAETSNRLGQNGQGGNVYKNGIDWEARAKAIAQFKEEVSADMGFEPIWTKDDNLFGKIHQHYQAWTGPIIS